MEKLSRIRPSGKNRLRQDVGRNLQLTQQNLEGGEAFYETIQQELYDNCFNGTRVDLVALYKLEALRAPLLTAQEEIDLATTIVHAKQAQKKIDADPHLSEAEKTQLLEIIYNGKIAYDQMFSSNTRLVIHWASRKKSEIPLLDLIQEGNIGLMRAIDKFDPQMGKRFSTYATWWIRQTISRAIANKERAIRLPVHIIEEIKVLMRLCSEYESLYGNRPSIEELAVLSGKSKKKIKYYFRLAEQTVSLNDTLPDGETEIGETISSRDELIEQQVLSEEYLLFLKNQVNASNYIRGFEFLLQYLGLDGTEPKTLDQIARDYQNKVGKTLSRERVRQLIVSVRAYLRDIVTNADLIEVNEESSESNIDIPSQTEMNEKENALKRQITALKRLERILLNDNTDNQPLSLRYDGKNKYKRLKKDIEDLISNENLLTPLEYSVIQMRYLGNEVSSKTKTYKQLALTKYRMRAIEATALDKIRTAYFQTYFSDPS